MLPRATDDGFSCSEAREIIYYNMIYIIIIQTPVPTHIRMHFWFKLYFTAHLLLLFCVWFCIRISPSSCMPCIICLSSSSQSFPINTYNLAIVYLRHYYYYYYDVRRRGHTRSSSTSSSVSLLLLVNTTLRETELWAWNRLVRILILLSKNTNCDRQV